MQMAGRWIGCLCKISPGGLVVGCVLSTFFRPRVTLRCAHAMNMMKPMQTAFDKQAFLGELSLRTDLVKMVRRVVPPADVDDIVQTALTDALASTSMPDDKESARRWLFGVCKRKVADHYRERRRELPSALLDESFGSAEGDGDHRAADLLRWAEKEIPSGEPAKETLDWMLREADGEKLEHIAEEARVPSANVRQRVVRMRAFYKERYVQQIALLGIGAMIAVALWFYVESKRPIAKDHPQIQPVPNIEIARKIRVDGLHKCDQGLWNECEELLDRAKGLDAPGENDPSTQGARKQIEDARKPRPPVVPEVVPTAKPSPRPTSTSLSVPTIAPSSSAPARVTPTKVGPRSGASSLDSK